MIFSNRSDASHTVAFRRAAFTPLQRGWFVRCSRRGWPCPVPALKRPEGRAPSPDRGCVADQPQRVRTSKRSGFIRRPVLAARFWTAVLLRRFVRHTNTPPAPKAPEHRRTPRRSRAGRGTSECRDALAISKRICPGESAAGRRPALRGAAFTRLQPECQCSVRGEKRLVLADAGHTIPQIGSNTR